MGLSGNMRTEKPALAAALPGELLFGVPGPAGYTPVRGVDYWTEEDRQEILSQVQPLTQGQIDLLNAILSEDTLICFPQIEAAYTGKNIVLPDGEYARELTVTAHITDIDRNLVQKAEVGIGINRVEPNGIIYRWHEAELSLGDTAHTAVFTCQGGDPTYPLFGFLVRLTYYSLIGGTNELTAKAVYME